MGPGEKSTAQTAPYDQQNWPNPGEMIQENFRAAKNQTFIFLQLYNR